MRPYFAAIAVAATVAFSVSLAPGANAMPVGAAAGVQQGLAEMHAIGRCAPFAVSIQPPTAALAGSTAVSRRQFAIGSGIGTAIWSLLLAAKVRKRHLADVRLRETGPADGAVVATVTRSRGSRSGP